MIMHEGQDFLRAWANMTSTTATTSKFALPSTSPIQQVAMPSRDSEKLIAPSLSASPIRS